MSGKGRREVVHPGASYESVFAPKAGSWPNNAISIIALGSRPPALPACGTLPSVLEVASASADCPTSLGLRSAPVAKMCNYGWRKKNRKKPELATAGEAQSELTTAVRMLFEEKAVRKRTTG